jgi:hypothetical protein
MVRRPCVVRVRKKLELTSALDPGASFLFVLHTRLLFTITLAKGVARRRHALYIIARHGYLPSELSRILHQG